MLARERELIEMRRALFRLFKVVALGAALGGCAKCGGWEKFNLPYSAGGCDDGSKIQK
jgi:hypothetical protein